MKIQKAQHVTYEFSPLSAEEMSDLKAIALEYASTHTTKALPAEGEKIDKDPVEDRRIALAYHIARNGESVR